MNSSNPSTSVTTRGADLFERAQRVMPGGVSRNTVLRSPHPTYAISGQGCRVTDTDGVTRIDFSNNMASLIHGHACPEILDAVRAQLERGSAFMMATEAEVEYAELLCNRVDSFDMIRFVNSGTEAIMTAIKAARAFTGRHLVAKAEGAYHGGYDAMEVSQVVSPADWGDEARPSRVPLTRGNPPSATAETVVYPFNDIERTIRLLDEHAEDLACVVLDLMPHRVGLRPADREFVHALREWTSRHGALLVLDEVITFRSEFAGLQAHFKVKPDLTALGKMIGGGLPIGAVAGRAEVMDIMNPRGGRYLYPVSGTFSGNPTSAAAGLAALTKFTSEEVERLNSLARRAMEGIEAAARATGARASVTGYGSMFRVHMKASPPANYREAYLTPDESARLNVLLNHLFDSGFVMINTCTATLSTPMQESEIDQLVEAIRAGFEIIAEMP